MAIFQQKETMEEMFGEIWTKLVKETSFGKELKENGISIYFEVTDPSLVMYVDSEGPLFSDQAKAKTPVITLKMSGDTVHKFWLNSLNIPKAIALRQVKAKGPIAKVLQVLPLLKPGKEMYPEYCAKYNLPTE